MTKQEFLEMLRKTLNRELDAGEVEENIRYYDEYIRSELAKGRTEEEIIRQLGDPRLIAKTILQVDEQKGIAAAKGQYYDAEESVYTENADGTGYYSQESSDQGYYQEKQEFGRGFRPRVFQLKGWQVTLALILILIIIFALLGTAMVIFWKLLPVLLVLWVIFWVKNRFF